MRIVFRFDEKSLKKLEKLKKQNKELVEKRIDFLKRVAVIMFQSVMQNFREEGTDKEKWEPLSPVTIAMRQRKKKGSVKILQDTGRLRNSIFPVIGYNYAAVGTNVEYAKIHQFGGKIRIPAMTILPVRKKALRFVIDGEEVFAKKAEIPARTVKIPKRPFLWLRENHKERIINLAKKMFRIDL